MGINYEFYFKLTFSFAAKKPESNFTIRVFLL